MKSKNNEVIRRKLYTTLYRLGITPLPELNNNIYIDDSGFVLIIQPDGVIELMGKLSYCGEFICNNYPEA